MSFDLTLAYILIFVINIISIYFSLFTSFRKVRIFCLLYFFSYKMEFLFFFQKIPINQDPSRSLGLTREGKTGNTAKLHRTDLVICSHSGERKTLSYSWIIWQVRSGHQGVATKYCILYKGVIGAPETLQFKRLTKKAFWDKSLLSFSYLLSSSGKFKMVRPSLQKLDSTNLSSIKKSDNQKLVEFRPLFSVIKTRNVTVCNKCPRRSLIMTLIPGCDLEHSQGTSLAQDVTCHFVLLFCVTLTLGKEP